MCIAIAGSRSIGEYEIPLQSLILTSLYHLPFFLALSSFVFRSFSFAYSSLSAAWVRYEVRLV